MPSQPLDSGWDFNSVINLIDSDTGVLSSPTLTPRSRPLVTDSQDGGVSLGSFAKLYESLGLSTEAPSLPPLDESDLSNSDDVLLPSPILEIIQAPHIDDAGTADLQVLNAGLSKKQRQKARRQAERDEELTKAKELKPQLLKQLQALADAAANANPKAKEQTIFDAPSKPSRTLSRSNVGAKIRPASPTPMVATAPSNVAPVSPKKPKTPKPPRPSILKRPSTAQPATLQPTQANEIVQPAPIHPQYTTFGTLAPAPSLFPQAPQRMAQTQPPQPLLPQPNTPSGQHGLVPRTVRPTTVPRNSQRALAQAPLIPTPVILSAPVYPTPVGPPTAFTIRSQVDRHFHLFNKLVNHFADDRKWLVSPMQLINEKTAAHGLHVFVDASNIMIGFKDMLRNYGIQPYEYDMSFDSLALLMERRRPVAKRVFAGSQREANPLPQVTKLVETSKAVGYDSVMQEQVLIVREDSEKKKFFNDVKKHGWHKATQIRSGSGSDSETGPPAPPKTPSAPKWVEQGVDEILHLKMCQSIIDTEVPSTMVLATGDGAEAEMSDGFLAHVERALKKGWKVELISWRQQTNGGYKNRKFRAKWAEQFQIIELDDFLEDLIDTP